MLTRYARTSVALALLASVALLPLAGCDYVEQQTGMSKSTQTGALGGAAIGDYLGKQDAEKHAESNLHALDTLGQGQTSSWSDAKSGNYGSTTVTSVMSRPDGGVCKGFTETVHTKAETVTKEATACRTPGHDWQIQRA